MCHVAREKTKNKIVALHVLTYGKTSVIKELENLYFQSIQQPAATTALHRLSPDEINSKVIDVLTQVLKEITINIPSHLSNNKQIKPAELAKFFLKTHEFPTALKDAIALDIIDAEEIKMIVTINAEGPDTSITKVYIENHGQTNRNLSGYYYFEFKLNQLALLSLTR